MNGLIITRNFKPIVGGVQEYTHQMAAGLHSLGENIAVVAPQMEGAAEFDASCGYQVIRHPWPMPGSGRFFHRPVANYMRLILERAKAIKADYLISNHWKNGLGIYTFLSSRILRIPYFIFAYGSEVTRSPRSPLKRWERLRVYRSSHRVISISRFTQEKVSEIGVMSARCEIVPCGFDATPVDQWRGFPQSDFPKGLSDALYDRRKIIFTVSRLEQRKGIDKVIEAMPQVLQAVPNVIYLIGGMGPYESELKELVRRKGLGGHVRFLGYLSEDEKFACYQNCDVFIMPSRILSDGDVEGFGIVFLEAGAFGKPIIGGRSGGIPDAIVDGETGLLVDPNDTGAIAKALIRILTDSDLAKRLGGNGVRYVREVMTWENSARKLRQSLHNSIVHTFNSKTNSL